MTKGEITFPNDFHIIKNRKCDRDVLGSLQWKWATIVKKIAAGRTTDDLCLIAGTTGDFYFCTLTTSSIAQPITYSFTGEFFLTLKQPALETYASFYLVQCLKWEEL